MSRNFYFDCSSGISGDMTVAALLDLGADREVLEKMIASLQKQGIEGFQVKISRVKKSGMDACDFSVLLDEIHENHDHDMAWLHGKQPTENNGETVHLHHIHHTHRSLSDILHIIEHADMTQNARKLAVRMFTILAEAEAKAHGVKPDEVHFHEVGAVDSIVDILSVAVCADDLGMDSAVIPWLHEGEGMIRCQHGMIPVPVPAVTAIVQSFGLKLRPAGIEGELVTPTGAAIAACFKTSDTLPQTYRIIRCGIGAGKREYGLPGILRIMLLEEDDGEISPDNNMVNDRDNTGISIDVNNEEINENHSKRKNEVNAGNNNKENNKDIDDIIIKLETDIDDCSGEALGYCMDQLFAAGARDVHFLPVFMKKNRPGYQLQVICTNRQAPQLENIIFRETTTIGIRRIAVERTVMPRKLKTVPTPWGDVRAKECEMDGIIKVYPEYEDVAAICRREDLPFEKTFRIISGACIRAEDKQ